MAVRVTLVEDDTTLQEIARHHLEGAGYAVRAYSSGQQALDGLEEDRPDLILTDLILEGPFNGDDLLFKLKETHCRIPVILMTANGTIESAVSCVKAGAWTYLAKPFHWDEMLAEIKKALRFTELEAENQKLKSMVGSFVDHDGIIGESTAMTALKKQLPRFARSSAPTLIFGESGTGKEMVARSIHFNSEYKEGPFVAFNCGAIVKELAESELFGHAKGAFTGAHQNKKGYFREAHGGTLFLDEVGELPLDLQVKLLRVLQEQEVTPVGESHARPIQVRLITATHVDLEAAIQSGDFREDLFYRVSVLPLHLPPLRERHGDLPLLTQHFLERLGCSDLEIQDGFWERVHHHTWPGNIRELENFITRLSVMVPEGEPWSAEHTEPLFSRQRASASIPYEVPDEGIHLDVLMRGLFSSALKKTDGNQTRAAKLLGISRSTLIYRMQKFEISG
jgi:two-component system NtrC family response regulator